MSTEPTRLERDLLGVKEVPADAYYGVQTARALENFQISGVQLRLYPNFIKALAMVKLRGRPRQLRQRAVRPTRSSPASRGRARRSSTASSHDQFLLDVFQGGAGTSTNMNANEVIANRALELMGHQKGEYKYCDPHDHVNRSQSTNDAYPTALHVGMALGNAQAGRGGQRADRRLPRARARSSHTILKMGRTQLQDAVPMTLGQEFTAFARDARRRGARARRRSQRVLCEINMGATAIGTGLNAPAGYAEKCADAPRDDHGPADLPRRAI